MKKRMKWMLTTGVMLLALTGCQAKTEERVSTTNLPEEMSVVDTRVSEEQMNTELELSITHEKCSYLSADGLEKIMSVDIGTPCIKGGTQTGIETINAWCAERRIESFEQVEGKMQPEEGEVNDYLLQLANENYKLFYEEDLFNPFSYVQGYRVYRFDEKVLSMTEESYLNSGEAHGISLVSGYTFDMNSGEKLTLQDISTDINTFMDVCEAEINRQIEQKKAEGIEFYEQYQEYVREIICDDMFYLTNEAVGFISQEYMLQPYTSGTIFFEIPYEQLGDLVNTAYISSAEDKNGTISEEEITLPDRMYVMDFVYDVGAPMLNKILPRVGLSYLYGEAEAITELSDALKVGMIAGAISDDYAYEEEWYVESLGGYEIPQKLFDQYAIDLFGKTVDLSQFAVNEQLGMAIIAENHQCIVVVGDWGLEYPTYEIKSYKEQEDGKFIVNVNYGMILYEETITTEYVRQGIIEVSPCEASKYGYAITKIELADMNQ